MPTAEQRSADLLILAAWADVLADRFGQLEQARRVRKVRGAWRRPALAGSAAGLERSLVASYWRLAREVLASLRGHSDDVATGRIGQQHDEERAAAEFFDLTDEEVRQPVDRTRVEAVLLLLALWRRRHGATAEEAAGTVFDAERQRALGQVGFGTLVPTQVSTALRASLLDRYRADLDRLEVSLREGTRRAEGLREIVTGARTVGVAAAAVRRLFDEELFRVSMFTESIVWSAALEGYRAGAVEATQAALAAGEEVPQYAWAGPQDEKTCEPCAEMSGTVVEARTLDDIPFPQDVCQFGRACRHWWRLATG